MAKLGENIRTARLDCNLSQEQLAKMLGIKSGSVIYNWEKCTARPDIEKIPQLCEILHTTPDVLFGVTGEYPSVNEMTMVRKYRKAIGTVEFFDEEFPHIGRAGLMRLDLASAYETTAVITEVISLAQGYFPTDFDVQKILVKIKNSPKREKIFTAMGFQTTDDFRPGLSYYVYYVRDISYCGLACALCSENENCVGCQNGGCEAHGWCKNYLCCREKKISGCSECAEFSCNKGMLTKMRIRAFSRFAQVYGKKELIRCLHRNKANGIVYHYEGQLVGDYDQCESESAIIQMILDGKKTQQDNYE